MPCSTYLFKAPHPGYTERNLTDFLHEAVVTTLPRAVHWYHRVKTWRTSGSINGTGVDQQSLNELVDEWHIPKEGVVHSDGMSSTVGGRGFSWSMGTSPAHLQGANILEQWSLGWSFGVQFFSSTNTSSQGSADLNPNFTFKIVGRDELAGQDYEITVPMYGPNDISGELTVRPYSFWRYGGIYDPTTGQRVDTDEEA